MMRSAMKALLLSLGLFAVLSLPAAAAETPAAGSPALTQAPATPAAVTLAEIFGTAPAPKQTSGTVDCYQCGTGTNSANAQCNRLCNSYGRCADQCYADADTCQLVSCICLYC
jgi:hypothetical protein